MRIRVRQEDNCDPWLVALSILLALSTLGFGWLAVRNARPLECDRHYINDEGITVCERMLE